MSDNSKQQSHRNKQSPSFQPGSPNKRKNNHLNNDNLLNINNTSNNNNNNNKRKPPRKPENSNLDDLNFPGYNDNDEDQDEDDDQDQNHNHKNKPSSLSKFMETSPLNGSIFNHIFLSLFFITHKT